MPSRYPDAHGPLLGLGISLFMVGTVELGLLGALRNIIEGKSDNPNAAALTRINATVNEIASRLGVEQDTAGSAGSAVSSPPP
jgi:hypothetical protein